MSQTTSSSMSPAASEEPDLPSLLNELAGSGQSTASFARAHGLPPWKLYQALRQQLRRSERSSRARGASGAELVPVRVAPPRAKAAPIELVTAGGLRLCVPPDFDEAHLRRLLGVLGGC